MQHRPRATYRLQLRGGVGFDRAAELVPYLHRLGIGDLYLSPPFAARQGSTHGYDVVDPNRLDPELGGEAAFARLAQTLKRHEMGLLLDIVPNHMGIGADNPWWWDVLKHGRQSRYAGFFDIDFERDPDGKLVLPVLGAPLEQVIERGEIELAEHPATGEPVLRYFDETFPFTLSGMLPGGTPDPRTLARLVDAQPYRLVFWQEGTARRNYRRFFNIDQLAGLKVEQEEVFEESHKLILDLVARDLIQGLRIDHIDGLTEPRAYLDRLQRRIADVRPEAAPFYVVVEKILIGEEQLPDDWPVAGTTGYEFMNEVLGLLVDPGGLAPLERLAAEITGEDVPYPELLRQAKEQVLERLFAGELGALADRAARLLGVDRPTAEAAVRELLLAFPVYRTYGGTQPWREADRAILDWALATAREHAAPGVQQALDRLEEQLGGALDERSRPLVWGIQQLSGPLMAKAAEDTAFYRHARLIALNEVGGEPDAHGLDAMAWHELAARRQERWPGNLLATATHDTKRGEDARARLAALSELPEAWAETVRRWFQLNAPLRADEPAIHAKDEYTLYQTLVGVWPTGLDTDAGGELDTLRERLQGWQTKALREGKERSDWHATDEAYEQAAAGFLKALLDAGRSREFLEGLAAFVARLAPIGAANSLAQLLLKLTSPGVPDIYQGTELWDLSLVDPDNRRPVDFALRERLLASPPAPATADWRDGTMKLAVLHRGLGLRARLPALFAQGGYRPLAVTGPAADRVLAFAREHEGAVAISVIGHRLGRLLDGADRPAPDAGSWGDTAVLLPGEWRQRRFTSVLDDRAPALIDGAVRPAALLERLPVGLLVAEPG